MAIIKCPECGMDVSDKSNQCIHCGCPMDNISIDKHIIIYNGIEYDACSIDELLLFGKKRDAAMLIRNMTGCGLVEAVDTLNDYINTCVENGIDISKTKRPSIIKCPTCHSANVERISGTAKLAGALTFGLFSNTARSQFKCKNCGYKW